MPSIYYSYIVYVWGAFQLSHYKDLIYLFSLYACIYTHIIYVGFVGFNTERISKWVTLSVQSRRASSKLFLLSLSFILSLASSKLWGFDYDQPRFIHDRLVLCRPFAVAFDWLILASAVQKLRFSEPIMVQL